MRRISLLLFIAILIVLGVQCLWSYDAFEFPSTIKYKLLKNNKVLGSCRLDYEKQGKLPGTSTLKLINFEGLGFTSQEWLLTYMFTKDSSIYATFTLKVKNPVSEIRLKEGVGFDGKSGHVFVYKELDSPEEMQTELVTQYPVIDLISSFYVTSQKVANGNHSKTEKFNFLFGKSTKIMDMMYVGTEKVPYQGKEVTTHVLIIRYNNVEIFRFKIFKDSSGYFFPVSVLVVTDFTGTGQETFEMRADQVK